ncbi:MAG: hypothetical protein JXQ73_06150 [Phycisphaerae bacterium]|nr:hypothetical protein [Phycisphaerae bacterium]
MAEWIGVTAYSATPWSREGFAEEVFRLLRQSDVCFERWGTVEPLRGSFDASAGKEWVDVWNGEMADSVVYLRVVSGRPRWSVMFLGGRSPKAHVNTFSLECVASAWRKSCDALLELFSQLFSALGCVHGRICHEREYALQHDPSLGGGNAPSGHLGMLGIGHRECLPGIYWGNLFAGPIVGWLGEDRIRSCPCHEYREISPGCHLITAYPDVCAYEGDEAVAAKDAIREHLGVEHFYDRRFHSRTTKPPPLDFSGLYKPPRRITASDVRELGKKAKQMGGKLQMEGDRMTLDLTGDED